MTADELPEKDKEAGAAGPAERGDEGGGTHDRRRPIRKRFPGSPGAEEALRVAMERTAYGAVVTHTQSSLEAEVCGVLVGDVCEDEEGLFVLVRGAIPGGSTDHGSTHVTFTHDTWNEIHEALQRDYPKMQIVGWYHSHPGFGVEFSAMDKFIQENFFPAPAQFALLTDPLGGKIALCCNSDDGIIGIGRFWVDGREHRCEVAAGEGLAAPARGGEAAAGAEEMEALRAKLAQVTVTLDELRTSLHRFLTGALVIVCVGMALLVSYGIYRMVAAPNVPPRLVSYANVPVQMGDQRVLLGVAVVSWEVPPALNATYLQLVEKQLRELQKRGGLPAPGTVPSQGTAAPPTPGTSAVPAPSAGAARR